MDSSSPISIEPSGRDSATQDLYRLYLRSQRISQQLPSERTLASQRVESDETGDSHDDVSKGYKNETRGSSQTPSMVWEGNGEGDGEDTAVNSKSSSSANSVYQMKNNAETSLEQESTEPEQRTEEPYHVFTKKKKNLLVYLVSSVGLFSPLSSNIYFPAIGRISRNLHVSFAAVNLTVTVYMIVQAIAPSIWGPFSDSVGRRPIFVATMLVYLAANIGLANTHTFVELMVFRAIQAAGSAATISIGAGVIGDIATADERGGMMGTFGGTRMLGQAVGPVIGGLITQLVGYHGIFWFLFVIGSISLFLLIFLLPETLRPIAGNGTTRLVGFQRPLIYHFKAQSNILKEQDPDAPKRRVTVGSVFSPLRLLTEKDVFVTLLFGSVIYTVWSMVTSSTTTLLQRKFGIDDLQAGLAFLPNGIGCVVGSKLTGWLMDYDYKKTEREYRKAKNTPDDAKVDRKTFNDFPIEKARMRNIWWVVLIFVGTTVMYGYSFHLKSIAVPLVLQFFIAATATSVFSMNSTIVVDLYPGMSASATAVNNLMRCSVGALGVAFVEPILEAIGEDRTFLIFGLVTLGVAPLLGLEWVYGQKWRMARSLRLKKKQQEKNEMVAEKGKVMFLEQKIGELERRLREMENRER